MKNIYNLLVVLLLCSLLHFVAHAVGEGNIDSGGGEMGSGTGGNLWNSGNEGVRVTVVKTDGTPITTSFDLTNKRPDNVQIHFGKVSKLSYISKEVSPNSGQYCYNNPIQSLPRIISSSSGNGNINAIKSYFTDEQVIRSIATNAGMNFDILIGGQYKILLEPVAYFSYNGINMAMTATEAALYDQQVGGRLRMAMGNLTHKNLPLAIFLETADLGFPAWSGTRNGFVANEDIKSSLGVGIVRFAELKPSSPVADSYDYEYRVNTEVITAVTVNGGQSDPDRPVSVTFNISGKSYNVGNVFYPDGDSQLVWIRWTTPPTPQTVIIGVSVTGGGSANKGTVTAKISDLSGKDPPNPVADDRNDSFRAAAVPTKPQTTTASWGVWRPWWKENWVWISNWKWIGGDDDDDGRWVDRGHWEDHGWWEFNFDRYRADLSASMTVTPDGKNPTASGKTMKSGYGINQSVIANLSTNQSTAVTPAQNAVTYFPEFRYESYWRLLERISGGYGARFEFASNRYSTYNRRTHFTPIWMPDGAYKPYTWLIDCWTPAGMLSMNLTDSVTISGNLWQDWHIAKQKPK